MWWKTWHSFFSESSGFPLSVALHHNLYSLIIMTVGRSLGTLKHSSALQVHRTEKYLYSKSFNSVFPCNYHSTGASYLSSFSGDKWTRRGAISRGKRVASDSVLLSADAFEMRKRLVSSVSSFPGKSEIQSRVKFETVGACLLMETCLTLLFNFIKF
jgi:hypothetical protein